MTRHHSSTNGITTEPLQNCSSHRSSFVSGRSSTIDSCQSRRQVLLDRLSQRINRVLDGETHRSVGAKLHMSPETIRRYRSNSRPSLEFIVALIDHYGVSPLWLFQGIGPPRIAEATNWALSHSTTREIFAELFSRFAKTETELGLPTHIEPCINANDGDSTRCPSTT